MRILHDNVLDTGSANGGETGRLEKGSWERLD